MPLSTAERFRRLGLEVVGREARLLRERAGFRKLRREEAFELAECERVMRELRALTFPEPYRETVASVTSAADERPRDADVSDRIGAA